MVEETTQTTSHESTLFAEPVGHFGGLTITNSLINSWVAVFIIVVVSVLIGHKIRQVPRGIQNVFETIVEAGMNLCDSVTGNRRKSEKFFPFILALFLFIVINNWMGLLPGVGSIGVNEMEAGHEIFVPWFRAGAADLNTTLALALIAVVGSNVIGIFAVGAWHYFNKFVNIKAFLDIPRKILKDPTIILVNPIKAFVGLVEIIGEIAKVASLSFRLFGNIFAGEVLLMSMAALCAFVLPVPFMFLELIVGIIQALVFAVLTLVYLTIATTAEEH